MMLALYALGIEASGGTSTSQLYELMCEDLRAGSTTFFSGMWQTGRLVADNKMIVKCAM